MWFQQDSAPPHITIAERIFLITTVKLNFPKQVAQKTKSSQITSQVSRPANTLDFLG